MLQDFSNNLPSIIKCAKEVALEVAAVSFPTIKNLSYSSLSLYAAENIASCKDYTNRDLNCDYKVILNYDQLSNSGSISFTIKQSSCKRKVQLNGGSSFDVNYSPYGPPMAAKESIFKDNLTNMVVVDRLSLCRVTDNFDSTYRLVCPLPELMRTTNTNSNVSDNASHHSNRKTRPISYFPCINISINVDFEHFNAFSMCSIFGCHHSVLRRQILPFTVFCVPNTVTVSRSLVSMTNSMLRQDKETTMKRIGSARSRDSKLDFNYKIWNRHVSDFYNGYWVRYLPNTSNQSHTESAINQYMWQWRDMEVVSSSSSSSSLSSSSTATYSTPKLTHHRQSERHSINQISESKMSPNDLLECISRTPMWMTGDSHLRYIWDYVVMQLRNVSSSEYLRDSKTDRVVSNYQNIIKHNWITYASQFRNLVDHVIHNRGLGHLMNVTFPRRKLNWVFHVGFWDIYTAPLHQYILNKDAVSSLLTSIRKLKQSSIHDNVRLIWVQIAPLPHSYCNHSKFDDCQYIQISSRNNYAIKAMNQHLEREILKIGYPHLRIIRSHDIIYPRRQFNEIVCNNHFMCFQDDDMKIVPSGSVLAESIMRAACYY